MTLTEQEQVIYLANVILVAHADSELSPKEMAALDEIRSTISAKKGWTDFVPQAIFALGGIVAIDDDS